MDTQPHIDTQFRDVTQTLVKGLLLTVLPSARMVCYYPEPNVEYFRRIHRNGIEYIPVDVLPVGETYYVRV